MTICYNNYFVVISDITSILKETPNEDELLQLMHITDQWYDIGLSLQVRRNVLDDLKQSEGDDSTKLQKVINKWKDTKSSSLSWKTMIAAVEGSVINNKKIADFIRYCLKLSKLLLRGIMLFC